MDKPNFSILNLRTNFLTNPIGLDSANINFSWQLASDQIGMRQAAYQILVFNADQPDTPVWDSGRVDDDKSVAIAYDGPKLGTATLYDWTVTVWNELGEVQKSEPAAFETAVSDWTKWQETKFIRVNQSTTAPIFRVKRNLKGQVVRARLYITALGVYEAFVNGKRVSVRNTDGVSSKDYMNPGYGNRDVSLGYQTYDVTDHLKHDKSVALSAVVGTGWYFGLPTTASCPALKALLVIDYDYGRPDTIQTNVKDWRATLEGPVVKNGIYYGEDFDGRKRDTLGDFTLADYNDDLWINGAKQPDDSLRLTYAHYDGEVKADPYTVGEIIDGFSREPISVTTYHHHQSSAVYPGGTIDVDEYRAFQQPDDDLYQPNFHKMTAGRSIFGSGVQLRHGQKMVIDFGQNMAAVPHVIFKAAAGTHLKMTFAEALNDGSKIGEGIMDADGPKGSLYLKNLRKARAQAHYIFSGNGKEDYQTSTSFFGYRYIGIEANDDVTIYTVDSRAISSVSRQTGDIETNNANVNKLFSNILYGQLSNYFTTATDCPQRDEREFWSGDTQAFAPTAVYNFDSMAFLNELQNIMSKNTLIKGYLPVVVRDAHDEHFSTFSAGWSDAEIIVPWKLYLQSGDSSILAKNWAGMTQYWQYLETHERAANQAPMKEGARNFGDWLSFQGTSTEIIGDYYYGYVTKLMEAAASKLGRVKERDQYAKKFAAIKATFLKEHVTFDKGQLTIDSGEGNIKFQFAYEHGNGGVWEDNSQAALLWMLKLGFYDSDKMRDAAIALLKQNVQNKSPKPDSIRSKYGPNTLATGFLSTNILMPILSDEGLSDVAYDLLLQDNLPSWLYEVKAGATTVWERWNSYTIGQGFGNSEMNSFNHYSYGSVAEWMYRYMLGIGSDPKEPGFKHVILQPEIDQGTPYNDQERITKVNGHYDSYYGRISASWQAADKQLTDYQVTLPANTTATLYLPVEAVTLNDVASADGVQSAKKTTYHGRPVVQLELVSGSYHFENRAGKLSVQTAKEPVAAHN